jgi:hypothetical protein
MASEMQPSRLVVIAPESLTGQVIPLASRRVTVGRGQTDVLLDDPRVSRIHAALTASDGLVVVEDLGSRSGTTVNGVPVGTPQPLRLGDMVGFGPVVARVEGAANGPSTSLMAPVAAPPAQTSFTARDQYAGQLNNVGGSQYNAYLHTVVQQRNSFLQEIAATRTRARRLIWVGFILFVVGLAAFAVPLLRFMSQVGDSIDNIDPTQPIRDSPWSIRGYPVGLVGWAVAVLGTLLIVVGIVLHVVAASRRRRMDQTLPVTPPPWPGYGQPPQVTREGR